jgi:dipeptidyl aminopeptidase/acylaminoacyl peptidase
VADGTANRGEELLAAGGRFPRDRVGRLDLERQMGRPDDPSAAALYRRGSPVYSAERIEAPLLILHGRKDKRVVPLMSERIVEALEIEDKHHEVVWYDDEAHGWKKPETKRDAFNRILAFLRRHVLDEPSAAGGEGRTGRAPRD